jgi:isocitrate dehydrogenase
MNSEGVLHVPDNPIIPFIEGDGIGVDIWPAAKLVLDAAAKKYGKSIEWKEVLAGQKAFDETAAGFAPSTWRCARFSTSTYVCARCAGSKACPHPCYTPNSSTW